MSAHSIVLALAFAANLIGPPALASFTRSHFWRHARWAFYAADWLVIDAFYRHWLLASGAVASLVIALARWAMPQRST